MVVSRLKVFPVPLSLKLLLLFFFALARPQAQTTADCKERAVIVNALAANGIPIENLAGRDFKVSYHGQLVPVVWSQHRQFPGGRIIVLLDTSGSMKGESDGSAKWKIAHAAALEFVSSAPSLAQVSFMGFALELGPRFEASAGRRPIEDWLNRSTVREGKEVKGRTALYQTILAALRDLGPTNPGDAIYVITDGGDNSSKERVSRVEGALRGVRLFTFLLNGSLKTEEERSGIEDLYELTNRSGGFLVRISPSVGGYDFRDRTLAAIRTSTRMLQAQMASFYVLGIQFPDNLPKVKDWKVDVVDAGGHRRKDVTVTYPRNLPPAGCVAQSTP